RFRDRRPTQLFGRQTGSRGIACARRGGSHSEHRRSRTRPCGCAHRRARVHRCRRRASNVEGIYAIGDCNGRGAYYEIVAANLLDGARRSVRDRITSYALFTDPLLARVGLTDTEIRRSGRRALFSTRPMTRVGRAVEKGEAQGFMKVAVDAETREILGATI